MAELDEKCSFMELQKNGIRMKTTNTLIQSEQAVIGSILSKNECFDDIDLTPEEFLNESHRIIFSGICEFLNSGKTVDLIMLAEQFDRENKLESVGGLQYLTSLFDSVLSVKNIKYHAKNISDAAKMRRLKQLTGTIDSAINEGREIEKIIDLAESGFCELLEPKAEENFAHIKKAVAEAIDWEEAEHQGLSTGLRDLDRHLGGFVNSDLIIIAGRPSMGKSALACQIAEHVSNRESVVIFSLEMPKRQIASRFLKYHESRVGKSQAISHLYNLKMHIDDTPSITLGHIRSKCRTVKRQHGLSMIVVDYLQLMRGEGDNRNQEIGSLSRGLKSIAKEFDIPVVVLSQLSRKVEERTDKRPIMSDLRESGEIEQDADVILFIYRDEIYNPETEYKGLAEIICRKNRNGSIGDITAKFDGATTRFIDYNGERILRVVKTKERGFSI